MACPVGPAAIPVHWSLHHASQPAELRGWEPPPLRSIVSVYGMMDREASVARAVLPVSLVLRFLWRAHSGADPDWGCGAPVFVQLHDADQANASCRKIASGLPHITRHANGGRRGSDTWADGTGGLRAAAADVGADTGAAETAACARTLIFVLDGGGGKLLVIRARLSRLSS